MTNARLTGNSAAIITSAIRKQGVQTIIIQGYEAICELLTEHKPLRVMVPRLYGLGDLTEILDERSYMQAQTILAMMHDELARLVPVEAHRAAYRSLRDQRFVLLVGRPGSGKSSIAASLALGAMDLYDSRPIKLSHIEELRDSWNPKDANQFFWLDDGFGVTQYEQTSSVAWNRSISLIEGALHSGSRLIVTSRDYIYAAAREDLKIGAFPLVDEAHVVINVEQFTPEEREQILYNHLRLGRQPRGILKSASAANLETVSNDADFLPELARRLGDPLFTTQVRFADRDSLLAFFRRPVPYLLEVLTNLDGPSRAALGLVHLRGGRLPSPYEPLAHDTEFLERIGQRLGDAVQALSSLQGTFLRLVSDGTERWWQFQHPTFSDAYELWLERHPELLAEYLATVTVDDLMRTITCGEVGLEGALVVPRPLFGTVVDRLNPAEMAAAFSQTWHWQGSLFWFLARRCAAEFVRVYVDRYPEIVDRAFTIGLYLSAYTSHRELCHVLMDLGIASEHHRARLVESLTNYAVDFEDGSFLGDSKWLKFFTQEELHDLDSRVMSELEGFDERIAEELRANELPFSSIDNSVSGYEARYPEIPDVHAARRQIEQIKEYTPEPDLDAWNVDEGLDGADASDDAPRERMENVASIFDDVAE
jgi:energy-coupling factor transporter ATP-binding protein EcfA2